MVTFNCEDCGTTVRKNKLQAHRCSSRTFCCIDCQKQMPLNQAISHNECLSEEKKYMGSDYKGEGKKRKATEQLSNPSKVQVNNDQQPKKKFSMSHLGGSSDSEDEDVAKKTNEEKKKKLAAEKLVKPVFLMETDSEGDDSKNIKKEKKEKKEKKDKKDKKEKKENKAKKFQDALKDIAASTSSLSLLSKQLEEQTTLPADIIEQNLLDIIKKSIQ